MPTIALGTGIALIVLGIAGYAFSGAESITALIPAFFGIVLAALGVLARKENLRRHMMHAASVVALLGLIGSASGIPKVLTLLSGGDVARPAAAVAQTLMALLCVGFLVPAVKSFVDARRKG